MSFSLRLTAELALAWAARAVGAKSGSHFLQQVRADELFDQNPAPAANLELGRFRAPLLWISGSETLEYPQAAPFANSLAAAGRHVFLESSGSSVKQRLHEFQPSPRFCFAIRFDDCVSAHGWRIGVEALRMARLAGFYSCARIVLQPNFSAVHLEELHNQLSGCDVDGILVTCADSNVDLIAQAAALRRRWLNRSCAILSTLLDGSLPSPRLQSSTSSVHPSSSEPRNPTLGEEAEAG